MICNLSVPIVLRCFCTLGDEHHIIYFWQGRDSTARDKGTAAALATRLDDDLGGKASQVTALDAYVTVSTLGHINETPQVLSPFWLSSPQSIRLTHTFGSVVGVASEVLAIS